MFEHSFAVLLDTLNRGKEAAQRHADALSYAEALGQQLPNHLLVRRELIRIRWNYLLHLQRYGQYQQAIALCKRSTAESERLSARFPQIPIFKHQQARFAVQEMQLEIDDMVRRGDVSAAFKKLPEQEKLLRRVLATQEETYKPDPRSVDGRLWLAEHLDKLAGNLLVSGTLAPQKLKESLILFDRAVKLQEEVAADTPGTPQNRLDLAACHAG